MKWLCRPTRLLNSIIRSSVVFSSSFSSNLPIMDTVPETAVTNPPTAKLRVTANAARYHKSIATLQKPNSVATPIDIKEGLAVLSSASAVSEGQVFYNPVQEFNRDMSSAVLSVFIAQLQHKNSATKRKTSTNGIEVLEALAASGFRSCRYAREVPGITKIIANDISKTAFSSIQQNAEQNNVAHLVEPCNMDAIKLMYKLFIDERLMHAIDIDPYGTSGPFLEPALRALHDGGLLMITSTDSAVMCGNTPEVCLKRYHAMSLRMPSHHEMAVRILLGCISRRAATLDRYIRPLVSMQEGFYIRVFVQVFDGALETKDVTLNNAYVYNCSQCTSFSLQPLGMLPKDGNKYSASLVKDTLTAPHAAASSATSNNSDSKFESTNQSIRVDGNPDESSCSDPKHGSINRPTAVNTVPKSGSYSDNKCRHCGTAVRMGGPIWTGPLIDPVFAQQVCEFVDTAGFYKTAPKIKSKLALLRQELSDVPLFWVVSDMCRTVHCSMIPLKMARSAIKNAGYRVSGSHCHREGVKTDAPSDFLWDMVRAWVATHNVKHERVEGQPAQMILEKKSTREINFAMRADADPLKDIDTCKAGAPRYPENPQPHWGPKKMASAKKRSSTPSQSESGPADVDAVEPPQKKLVPTSA